jgi:hypothetical protein
MGKPIKLTLQDETMFLCGEGCEKEATANADRTPAWVEGVKIGEALAQLDPADRQQAEEQKFCAVDELVEQEEGMVAGTAEMAVGGTARLVSVGLAHRAVPVSTRIAWSLSSVCSAGDSCGRL